ncbi:hypothetical protein C5167_043807 [Papaver somniferum]|uniref:Photosystem I iron-sulfur center n=1 Tax=Papaver somniferum TaxID=3469 RepID=A0A4Y7L6V9_PAPSO|nr:hypothetical protein C5167_043807 [Papaver somniferum]
MMFKKWIDPMSHSVKIYDICIGCTQCVRACPTDVLEMIPWDGCKAKQIASDPRTEDCVGCKRCESACPTDFLSVRVYLWHETTRSMGYFLEYEDFWSKCILSCLYYEFFPWLTIIVVLPIFAGFSIFFLPHRGNKVIRWYIISICILELLLTTYTRNRWNFHRTHFIDGIHHNFSYFSGPASYSGFTTVPFLNVNNVHRMNSCLPTFIHVWGGVGVGEKRLYSATKFILYSAGGSIFLLMGVLCMGLYASNEPTLNFETLANQSYPVALEIIFYFGFLIAYAVKSPIIPLHTWLPDTYGETHYSTCMLLAEILLKMGAYGHRANNLCSFNISWETQFKKDNSLIFRISYGFYNYRNSLRNRYGTQRGHFANNFSWIYWCGAFFLAGTSYDRIHLVYLDEMGGIAIPMPKIFTMFSSFLMASLALPGMSGFVAELVIFFGIITSPKYLLMPKILITFLMAIGMILTPIYSLSMSRQMFYGYKQFNAKNSYFFDSRPRELFVSICIFLLVTGIGIYPDFVLSLSVDKVEAILSNYFSR